MTEVRFDARIAATYDATSAPMFDPAVVARTVDVLAELASGRPALEFAVGTGRIALPLTARGVEVHGIDVSEPMVEQMRAKPDGSGIPVTIGDMATGTVEGSFGLVYLVFNTIMNLTTQDEQVACFVNAAAHLEAGGAFVVEVGIPDLRRLPPGETFRVFQHTPEHVGVDEYDVAQQIEWSHHHFVVDGRLETFSAPYRYVWPAELDLMARIAGLRLRERWAGWDRAPFTSDSRSHVSVWEKPESNAHA